MILNHDKKFILISNGKTGTTSIEYVLRPYQQGLEYVRDKPGLYVGKHIPAVELRKKVGCQVWDEYFKFGFVRNPWDWVVSQFFWHFVPRPHTRRWQFFVKNPMQWINARRMNLGLSRKSGVLRIGPDEVQELHRRLISYRGIREAATYTQYWQFHTIEGERLVDFIGRFESLSDDWKFVANRLALPADLPTRNVSSRSRYAEHFTPDGVEAVRRIWALDIESFGYEFEN